MTILTDCPHCGTAVRVIGKVHCPDPSCHDPGMIELYRVEGCNCWDAYLKPDKEWDLCDALVATPEYYQECERFIDGLPGMLFDTYQR